MNNNFIYPNQNNTNFPQSLKINLGKLKYDEKKEFLKYHQYIVHSYVSQNPSIRGLLLYFNVGFGKTILAIALARLYKKIDPNRKIIVLLSKGLIRNFKDNIKKFLKQYPEFDNIDNMELFKEIDDTFKFISFRSNLMYKKISEIKKTDNQIEFEEKIGDVNKMISDKDDFLENTTLIIDEAHNFFNSITNGSKNSLNLYDTIMKTKDVKLFFLTGTPIINDPFELVPCFNMLKGSIPIKSKYQKIQKIQLLPESRKEFYNYFVDEKGLKIKNASRFQNRIMGLSSYFGDNYFEEKSKDFPEQFPTIVEKVPMSTTQFLAYDVARDMEKEEASYKKRMVKSERFSVKSNSGTYRIKTRQISNFVFPSYALGPKKGRKMQDKYIEKIKDKEWKDMSDLSPKIEKVMKNISKHKNQLGFIYTEFVSGEGIAVLSKVLDSRGYSEWEIDQKFLNKKSTKNQKSTKNNKTYAIITGKLTLEERNNIIEIFNSEDNKHGEKISLLLVNKIAAEGLDLKGVRHIHILEPFWNYARIEQVIGRGVRYKSHESFPKKERNVQPYIYLSDYPTTYPKNKIKEPTTDIDMYESVMNKKIINDMFNLSIIESSIDCLVHYDNLEDSIKKRINCKLCSPTDKPLYHSIISKDFSIPDPCKPIKEYKIKAKEIIDSDTGEKFAYTYELKNKKPEIFIYQYNDIIDGYSVMKKNHPLYSRIMSKILDNEK